MFGAFSVRFRQSDADLLRIWILILLAVLHRDLELELNKQWISVLSHNMGYVWVIPHEINELHM